MKSFFTRKNCRLCDSYNLKTVFQLISTPPANNLISKEIKTESLEKIPLTLNFCNDCFHLQLKEVVNPKLLFSKYLYVSGTSKVFLKHFEEYAEYVESFKYKNKFILDIGSNDGSLLSIFKKKKWKVLGVDPAENLAFQSNNKGIPTINSFFDDNVSKLILNDYGYPSVITANNVFAHVDDLKSLVQSIKSIMDKNCLFIFEVSYLLDVIQKKLFDTIYHEHVSYHSVGPLVSFFKNIDLSIVDIMRINSHGGSLRLTVQKSSNNLKSSKSIKKIILKEKKIGLYYSETFLNFEKQIKNIRTKLIKKINQIKLNGKKIIGFGAPAKATTLLYYFDLDSNCIDYIVDDNVLKQNKLIPGKKIYVCDPKNIINDKPDYIIIFAWNFSESIMTKCKEIYNFRGTFIIPLPELEEIRS